MGCCGWCVAPLLWPPPVRVPQTPSRSCAVLPSDSPSVSPEPSPFNGVPVSPDFPLGYSPRQCNPAPPCSKGWSIMAFFGQDSHWHIKCGHSERGIACGCLLGPACAASPTARLQGVRCSCGARTWRGSWATATTALLQAPGQCPGPPGDQLDDTQLLCAGGGGEGGQASQGWACYPLGDDANNVAPCVRTSLPQLPSLPAPRRGPGDMAGGQDRRLVQPR
jgi:hypothetical protein